jgi:hypothetical protein
MAIQIFDQNNQILPSQNIVVNVQQQLTDSQGSVINPAEENGNLQVLKNHTVEKLDINLSTRASETKLQELDNHILALSPKLDELKQGIITQLDTRVRGLFDAGGDSIDSVLVPIVGSKGIFGASVFLDQFLAFSKKLFFYAMSVNVNAADTKILAIVNPSNSNKILLVKRIYVGKSTDSSNGVYFQVRLNAQGVSGTRISASSTISGGTSVVNVYTAPNYTVTGNLRFILALSNTESSKIENFELNSGLNPGENLFIIGNATANNTPCFFTIDWAEV